MKAAVLNKYDKKSINLEVKDFSVPEVGSDDVLVKILKHPTVIEAKIVEDKIKLEIEFEILAEVIGETKMQVTVFNPIDSNDMDIEDLDIEVNEDFLN